MAGTLNPVTLQKAALISGLGLLISVIAAPFAELYVIPKIVIPFQANETAQNIMANQGLFVAAIFAYLLTFICDIVIAWGLYIFLKPVGKELSLLAAGLRIVYTILALVALNNLITAFQLVTTPNYLKLFPADHVNALAMVALRAFRNHWYFGLIFFGIHLLLTGYLALKSTYIPKVIGILILISGFGYFLSSIRPYLLPGINIDFALYTFLGEVIFMVWLLIKGWRVKD
jgi:hypothetical protein